MIEDGKRGRIDGFIKIMFISLTIYLLILFLNKINNLNLILGNLTIIVLLIELIELIFFVI